MKSLEEYIKENHPEILDEYNNYAKEAKIVDKEKAEKERANYRSQHRFWEFEFSYTAKDSIYDDDGEEKYIPFNYAFNLFSDDELAAKLVIVKPGEDGYEDSKSLIEIIKDHHLFLEIPMILNYQTWLQSKVYSVYIPLLNIRVRGGLLGRCASEDLQFRDEEVGFSYSTSHRE